MTSTHDTIYPPVHRLPPEIISKIFLTCLASLNSSLVNIPRCSIRCPPLSISFVCQSWRTLALQIPQLWAALAIGHEYGMFDADRVQEWMARSYGCPFSLELTFHSALIDQQKDVIPMIATNVSRWKALRLRVPGMTSETERLIQLSTDAVPQLEEFRLELYNPGSFNRREFEDSLFHQISVLCLQGSQFSLQLNGQRPYNLQHVFIRALEGAEAFLAIIGNCPYLEVLECVITSNGVEYVPPPAVLTCTTMHTLKISTDHDNIGHLLDALHLPSLETLSMVRRGPEFPTLSAHLRGMVERSHPPLRELGIWGYILAKDAIQILRLVPGLKSLGGDVIFFDSDFAVVKLMAPSAPRQRPLCLKIERFSVRHLPDGAYRKLAWMLSSRWDRAIPQNSQTAANFASPNDRAVSPPLQFVILGDADNAETFSRVLGVSRCVGKGMKITTQSPDSLLFHPSF
ncbi:hypothetical protein BD410DRAFT_804540 [Rickenella mellea]|uniref:Uncharacterized protein n=1 Tax=Rickenella mellea TaxID=50990 RepID=A0A4Y7Q0F7_9AGAM|nr:hypothetical protein BD410DRAFT_804540 [Rickenella mellea]